MYDTCPYVRKNSIEMLLTKMISLQMMMKRKREKKERRRCHHAETTSCTSWPCHGNWSLPLFPPPVSYFFLLIPNQSCNEDFGEGPLLLDLWLCSYFRGERQADCVNHPKPLKNFVAPLFQIYRVIKRRGRKCHFSCSSFDHPLIFGHNSIQPVIGQLSLILCPLGFMTHGLYLPVFNSQHQ